MVMCCYFLYQSLDSIITFRQSFGKACLADVIGLCVIILGILLIRAELNTFWLTLLYALSFFTRVLLLVVLFPVILEHLPEYALGIIMVYSGWKMIANIAHVRSEGRYALIMAGICGLLVFQLGIFEGLLLLLGAHALIQYIFMSLVLFLILTKLIQAL